MSAYDDYNAYVNSLAPVGWWRLDEESGATAANSGSGGAALDATYVNTPNLAGDQLGRRPTPVFDGVDQYVQLPSSALSTQVNRDDGTLITLVKMPYEVLFDATNSSNWIAGFGVDGNNRLNMTQVSVNDNPQLQFRHYQTDGSNLTFYIAPQEAWADRWLMVAFVWSKEGDYSYGFANGETLLTRYVGGTWTGDCTDDWSQIGAVAGGYTWPGSIAQVQLYGRALSAAEIAQMYNLFKAVDIYVDVTPEAGSATAAVIAPVTVLGGLTVTPEAGSATAAAIAPTTTLGSLAAMPAAASVTAAAIAPRLHMPPPSARFFQVTGENRLLMKVTKDPDATLDYGFDWSAWLHHETIIDSVWLSDELTVASDTNDDTTTVIWLRGGTARAYPYRVTNRITTSAGRIDDRSIQVYVAER